MSQEIYNFLLHWRLRWTNTVASPLLPLPEKKVFKPKNNLPALNSYKGSAPDSFWDIFPSNYVQPAPPSINAVKLERLAIECGFKDKGLLGAILNDVKYGAVIGCRGHFRDPSFSSNAPSAYEDGEKVTDAIASWAVSNFVYGLMDIMEVLPNAKFSGIMTRPKPNRGQE